MSTQTKKAAFDAENIPDELRQIGQWVNWRLENGTKPPYHPKGYKADKTDPNQWSSFKTVEKCKEKFSGVGFCISPEDPYCGIDLDGCLDDQGHLRPWAIPILDKFETVGYAEISPSGKGIKLITQAAKPTGATTVCKIGDNKQQIECYDRGAYFTLTSNVYAGCRAIGNGQAAVDWLCETYLKPKVATQPAPASPPRPQSNVEDRAAKYLATIPQAISGQGGHNATFYAACRLVLGFDLSPDAAFQILASWNQGCVPPWSDTELWHKLHSANKQTGPRGWLIEGNPNYSPGKVDHYLQKCHEQEPRKPLPTIRTFAELQANHTGLRRPVIYGLAREGETINVISAPKIGKSWLAIDLALSVVHGYKFLNEFGTAQGKVLMIDNELHGETIAERIPMVANKLGYSAEDYGDKLHVVSLRGQLASVLDLGTLFETIPPNEYKVIVIDAMYRALPVGTDENDNAAMAGVYNLIDSYAMRLGCCFVLIHHTSKGTQGAKSVTDVGAGAGSMSRAADAHVVLRHHDEVGAIVLDAACRSWAPIKPRCFRWDFPVWVAADDLDPAMLKTDKRPGRQQDRPERVKPEVWTAERFAAEIVGTKLSTKAELLAAAESRGIARSKARDQLIPLAESQRLIHRHKFSFSEPHKFSTLTKDELAGGGGASSENTLPTEPGGVPVSVQGVLGGAGEGPPPSPTLEVEFPT